MAKETEMQTATG